MTSSLLPTYARYPLAFEKGEGCWLETSGGDRYLDLGGGIAVASLGYSHPHLVEALTKQAGKLWHTSNLFEIPQAERLAQRSFGHHGVRGSIGDDGAVDEHNAVGGRGGL